MDNHVKKNNNSSIQYFDQDRWKDSIFQWVLCGVTLLHLILLLIDFTEVQESSNATKEVALAVRVSSDQQQNADFLAQAHQVGSGKFRDRHQIAMPIAEVVPLEQHLEDDIQQVQQDNELHASSQYDQETILLTTLSTRQVVEQQRHQKALQALQQQFQAKAAMVASIEAQYLQHQHHFSRQQKIKTLDSIQAKYDVSAGYLEQFRKKVEFYGNRNYPVQAKSQHLAGEVRLMVILNSYGAIRAICLLESSGSTILDEAAKESVKKASPFGLFDRQMQEVAELRIVRTWRFDPVETEFKID